jgi:hypothetical protein
MHIQSMRRLSGFNQSRTVDIGIQPVLKFGFGIINRIRRLRLAVARPITPSMVPVAAPYILGVAPKSTEVLIPAEARRRYGYD